MKLDLALAQVAAECQAAEHRQAAAALTDPMVWQKRRHHTECAGRADVLVEILRTLPAEVDQELAKRAAKDGQIGQSLQCEQPGPMATATEYKTHE